MYDKYNERATRERGGGSGGGDAIKVRGTNREGHRNLKLLGSHPDGGQYPWPQLQLRARQSLVRAHPQNSQGFHQEVHHHHPSIPLGSKP